MKEIKLSNGKYALVSDEDFDELSKFSWYQDKAGYAFRWIHGYGRGSWKKCIKMHRQIMGNIKGIEYDHANRNKIDNRRENLRIASRSQNMANRGAFSSVTSGYKGVTWHSQHKKWYVQIYQNKKHVYRKLFRDKMLAARAYDENAIKIFGEFAVTNESLGLLK